MALRPKSFGDVTRTVIVLGESWQSDLQKIADPGSNREGGRGHLGGMSLQVTQALAARARPMLMRLSLMMPKPTQRCIPRSPL